MNTFNFDCITSEDGKRIADALETIAAYYKLMMNYKKEKTAEEKPVVAEEKSSKPKKEKVKSEKRNEIVEVPEDNPEKIREMVLENTDDEKLANEMRMENAKKPKSVSSGDVKMTLDSLLADGDEEILEGAEIKMESTNEETPFDVEEKPTKRAKAKKKKVEMVEETPVETPKAKKSKWEDDGLDW